MIEHKSGYSKLPEIYKIYLNVTHYNGDSVSASFEDGKGNPGGLYKQFGGTQIFITTSTKYSPSAVKLSIYYPILNFLITQLIGHHVHGLHVQHKPLFMC